MSMISGGDATFVRSQSPDAAVAVVTTASFAVGITLISRVRRFTCNFEAAPFGTVTGADFRIIAGVCVGTFGLVLLFYKESSSTRPSTRAAAIVTPAITCPGQELHLRVPLSASQRRNFCPHPSVGFGCETPDDRVSACNRGFRLSARRERLSRRARSVRSRRHSTIAAR